MSANRGRILCLDFGEKTCGIAATDPLGIIVQPVGVLRYKGEHDLYSLFKELNKVFFELKPAVVVVGYPCGMRGEEGEQAQKVKRFVFALKKNLKKNGVDPDALQWVLWDERFTTKEAERFLRGQGTSRKKRKKVVDKMAAVFILKSYLEDRG